MSTSTIQRNLWKKLQSKKYRHSFVSSQIGASVAAQIASTRVARGWTQKELAKRAKMSQVRISVLEDPSYENFSIKTLKRLAEALDTALILRFAPFSEMLQWLTTLQPGTLAVKSFQDYDALQARVKQVVEEGRAISRLNVQQAVEIGGLQARVRELDEVVKHYATCDEHRRKEWQADLDRLHQAEAENAAWRADLAHSREREEMHSQLRQDNHQAMLRLESENIALRARVERLESALRHIAEARWTPRTTASYDEDARYAYPERESYVRQYARRALEGKEEHGTKSND